MLSSWAVHHGEALEVLRDLPDQCIHALITDPPYSSGGQYRGDRVLRDVHTKYTGSLGDRTRELFAGDSRDQRSYLYWVALWLSEAQRVLVPGAPVVLFTDWRQLPTTTDAFQLGGMTWRGLAVWDKTEGARPQVGSYRSQAEYIVWGTNGPRDTTADASVGALPGVFRFSTRAADKFHVTGKPTALMREVVRICRPGGVVLDPFAGSGTTLVAALAEGRSAIGVERTAHYAAVAQERCRAQEEGRPYVPSTLKVGEPCP